MKTKNRILPWLVLLTTMRTLCWAGVRLHFAVAMAGALTVPSHAQSGLRIQEISVSPGGVRLVVTHPLAGSTNFVLQASSLLTNSWVNEAGATVRSLGFGRVELIAPPTTNAYRFYRTLSLVSTNDTDGDGLPNEIENALLTDRNKIDTDGDGFSDGVEVAFGTDPLNPNSFPSLTSFPRAEFVESISRATEGISPHAVDIRFDKPFFGVLKYTVSAESTANAPADFSPLSGSVVVSGTSASISIPWVDNTNSGATRLLFLQITNGPVDAYARGGRTRHTVVLSDNDSWWSAILKGKYSERNVRIKLLRGPSTSHVIFVAGGGQDGLPVLASEPPNNRSSQSEGVVPTGIWPGTVAFDTATHLKIISPPMPASSDGLFATSTGLTRTLTLESNPAVFATHFITNGFYSGTFTEVLRLPGANYLGCTNTGTFVLVRDIPAAPNIAQ